MDDPAVNTLVSGGEAGCVITHTATTPGGNVWVAWYHSSSGYDVRLQRLDPAGHAAFDPPALVSDQSRSWGPDLDLTCDVEGRAAVAWPSEASIGAALVGEDVDLVWMREFGVGSSAFLANPQVGGTDDGPTKAASATFEPGGLSGDGLVGTDDLLVVMSEWGPC